MSDMMSSLGYAKVAPGAWRHATGARVLYRPGQGGYVGLRADGSIAAESRSGGLWRVARLALQAAPAPEPAPPAPAQQQPLSLPRVALPVQLCTGCGSVWATPAPRTTCPGCGAPITLARVK